MTLLDIFNRDLQDSNSPPPLKIYKEKKNQSTTKFIEPWII